MEDKKLLNLTQEQKDKIYKEEMGKKKKIFANKLYGMIGEGGIALYIFLSSMLFGVSIPVYVVGMNPVLFKELFSIVPLSITGIIAMMSVVMFLGWMLFGFTTVEIYRRHKKNNKKNKKNKKWWEI